MVHITYYGVKHKQSKQKNYALLLTSICVDTFNGDFIQSFVRSLRVWLISFFHVIKCTLHKKGIYTIFVKVELVENHMKYYQVSKL